MPEQSKGNNYTSKINVFPVLYTIFFLLWGQKMDLFAPHGAIKSTLWPASRKKLLYRSYYIAFNLFLYGHQMKYFFIKWPILNTEMHFGTPNNNLQETLVEN